MTFQSFFIFILLITSTTLVLTFSLKYSTNNLQSNSLQQIHSTRSYPLYLSKSDPSLEKNNFGLSPDINVDINSDMDLDSDYGDLLDFNRPVQDKVLTEQYSLQAVTNSKPVPVKSLVKERKNYRKLWEYWDDFLEAELGDIEAELTEKDRWLAEARDYIELKRGRAIWSKRSEQEIQAEMKKALAARGLYIPTAVAQVITAVYIERTHKMKEYRQEDELACIEFRKWVREQKKKSKRDPILVAKLELTNRWLLRHPMSAFVIRPSKPRKIIPIDKKSLKQLTFEPKVLSLPVMDDTIAFPGVQKLDAASINFESAKAASASGKASYNAIVGSNNFNKIDTTSSSSSSSANTKSTTAAAGGGASSTVGPATFTSVSTWPPLVTSSMANWDKKLQDLPRSELAGYTMNDWSQPLNNNSNSNGSVEEGENEEEYKIKFTVDEDVMFVPSSMSLKDEYFVVL